MITKLTEINQNLTLDLSKVKGIFKDLTNNNVNNERSIIMYEDKFVNLSKTDIADLKSALRNFKKNQSSDSSNSAALPSGITGTLTLS